jgi:hypothetical protein
VDTHCPKGKKIKILNGLGLISAPAVMSVMLRVAGRIPVGIAVSIWVVIIWVRIVVTLTPLNWGTSSCDLTNGY